MQGFEGFLLKKWSKKGGRFLDSLTVGDKRSCLCCACGRQLSLSRVVRCFLVYANVTKNSLQLPLCQLDK